MILKENENGTSILDLEPVTQFGKLMIMNNRLAFLSTFLILASSCQDMCWFKDDELSLFQRDYSGDAIRLDGYYYMVDEQQDSDLQICSPYFFYRNGMVLYPGSFHLDQQEKFESDVTNSTYEDAYKVNKICWGVFQIENDTIRFEKWYPSSGGGLPTYIREGVILNDTVFHIYRSFRMSDGILVEEDVLDELYYFRHLSLKPDSSNKFIE